MGLNIKLVPSPAEKADHPRLNKVKLPYIDSPREIGSLHLTY